MDENKDLEEFVEDTEEEIFAEVEEDIEETEEEASKIDEVIEDAKDAFEDVKEGIEKTVADLKEKLDVDFDKEKVQGYLDDFTAAINDVMAKATETYQGAVESIKSNEKVNSAKDSVGKAANSVKETVANTYNKVMENETVKKTTDAASAKYQEFIHDENVRKTVVGATNAVKGAYNTIADAVKGIFSKDEPIDAEPVEETIEETEENKETEE